MEKELVLYGGAPPANDSVPDENEEDDEEDEEKTEPIASVSGIFELCNQPTEFTHI